MEGVTVSRRESVTGELPVKFAKLWVSTLWHFFFFNVLEDSFGKNYSEFYFDFDNQHLVDWN